MDSVKQDCDSLKHYGVLEDLSVIKAVLATQNETSTGVQSDISAVREAMDDAGHPSLLFVDGVSSIASNYFRMDR